MPRPSSLTVKWYIKHNQKTKYLTAAFLVEVAVSRILQRIYDRKRQNLTACWTHAKRRSENEEDSNYQSKGSA